MTRVAHGLMMLATMAFTLPARAQVRVGLDQRTNANPTIAAFGDVVALAFSAAGTSGMDVYVAMSRDAGRSFTRPVRVNALEGSARVSGDMPPRVALVPRRGGPPEVVVVWSAKRGDDWQLLTARSRDGGASYGAAVAVPGSDDVGVRGWESVAVGPSGRVGVLWIDHRETVAADARTDHTPPPGQKPVSGPNADPTARAGLSWLMFNALDGPPTALRVVRSPCYCCKTTMVASGQDLVAVWRHVFPAGERDIAFSRSRDGGRTFATPVRVSADRWRFDGCPDDGPSVALDARQVVHVVWATPRAGAGDDDMVLYHAASRDGRAFSPRVPLPITGPAGHAALATMPDGSTLVAWDEVVGKTRRARFARVQLDARDHASFTRVPVGEEESGAQRYPVLAGTSRGVIAAWVQQVERRSIIRVAPLP